MNNISMMLTAAIVFALLVVVTGVGLPKLAGARGSSANTQRPQSPFACNRLAVTLAQRKRHFELFLLKKSVRELPNGYEFEFPVDADTVRLVAEWAVGERACCPFFDIEMRREREGGSLWLSLTGRDGVRQFIQADGAAWIRQ